MGPRLRRHQGNGGARRLRTGLRPPEECAARRQLGYVGHVGRYPSTRVEAQVPGSACNVRRSQTSTAAAGRNFGRCILRLDRE
eukprot:200142-Pyramimonas_sp.AAC.1